MFNPTEKFSFKIGQPNNKILPIEDIQIAIKHAFERSEDV